MPHRTDTRLSHTARPRIILTSMRLCRLSRGSGYLKRRARAELPSAVAAPPRNHQCSPTASKLPDGMTSWNISFRQLVGRPTSPGVTITSVTQGSTTVLTEWRPTLTLGAGVTDADGPAATMTRGAPEGVAAGAGLNAASGTIARDHAGLTGDQAPGTGVAGSAVPGHAGAGAGAPRSVPRRGHSLAEGVAAFWGARTRPHAKGLRAASASRLRAFWLVCGWYISAWYASAVLVPSGQVRRKRSVMACVESMGHERRKVCRARVRGETTQRASRTSTSRCRCCRRSMHCGGKAACRPSHPGLIRWTA